MQGNRPHIGVAVYVSATDPTRTKQFPFRQFADVPHEIRDEQTGDVFRLVMRTYDTEAA